MYFSQTVRLRHEKRRRKLPELPKNRGNILDFIFHCESNMFLSEGL